MAAPWPLAGAAHQGRAAGAASDLTDPTNPLPALFDALAPPPVAPGGVARVLAQQVIPRLVQRHAPPGQAEPRLACAAGARGLAALAAGDDDGALRRALAGLQAQGQTAEAIADDWLGPAARELGRQWERDECSFVEVTIGVGRLQRALRQLVHATPGAARLPALAAPRVLLVLAPREQHSFGLSVVGEAFRREGWDVVGGGELSAAQAGGCVAREHFDLVGISVGSEQTAAGVPALCGALRLASRHSGIAILVGGPFVAAGGPLASADRLGADAVAADLASALAIARRHLWAAPVAAVPVAPTRPTSSPGTPGGPPPVPSRRPDTRAAPGR
jgi:MerR family transcriptional regulator, light-induced transcriptional regulator